MTHWMFRCHDVSRKVSHSMDAPLPLHQRMAVRIHLMMCRYCARFRRQLLALRQLSRHVPGQPSPESLPPETRERIKHALRTFS